MLEKIHDGWEVEEKTCIIDEKLNLKVTLWMKNREKVCKMDEKVRMKKWKKKMRWKFLPFKNF